MLNPRILSCTPSCFLRPLVRANCRVLCQIRAAAAAAATVAWTPTPRRIMASTELARAVPAAVDAPAPTEPASAGAERKRECASGARPAKRQKFEKKEKKRKQKPAKEGGAEEVLAIDIKNLLATAAAEAAEAAEEKPGGVEAAPPLPARFSEMELEIAALSSTADGLGLHGGRVYVVPFALPGDRVACRVVRHADTHSAADLVAVVRPSPLRDDARVRCPYFAKCGGCQLQMMAYADQLAHKKRVVEKAYANFFGLPQDLLPEIADTIGSPLQYGYRTKLTPHFDGPRKGGFRPGQPPPAIGFQAKGRRQVLDIEDCPIGTPAVREGMQAARKRVHENLPSYKRGATLLLRESTERIPLANAAAEGGELAEYTEKKLCITDNNATSVEYVDDYKFSNPAGAFFQNNNSILAPFTAYIRDALAHPTPAGPPAPPKYLVDAYCGSGLFSITLGRSLARVVGVDISADSVAFAAKNAETNAIPNARFIAGHAERIFDGIDFPADETSVIVDPPRKGCDEAFLDQLIAFGPRRVVYVSCNVHTQARDLAYLLGRQQARWRIEGIRGFDFFPQTGHVESVAVVARVG